ncbi:MAG TPA: terminase TerL endonuclease subunit [Candidatus Bathyarchaeia archaeon]|nr:terminase TerL endonuclease subunit [Candidatus Bathyarchaeia archaeon]
MRLNSPKRESPCLPQNFRHLSEAAKDLEAKVLGVQLRHNGDKVARWMMENVAILRDNNGNIRPVKPKDRLKKIDGVVAAVIANSRLIAAPADPYTTPEVITV